MNPPSHEPPGSWLEPVWLRNSLLIGLVAAVLAAGVSLVLPKSYRSEAKILPNASGSAASSLLGLAAASGFRDMLSSEIGNTENPVVTYPEILASTTLLERVALSAYPTDEQDPSHSVMKAIEIRGNDRFSLDKAVRRLRHITSVDANPRTGLIHVAAVTKDSVLSAAIVQKMLTELDHFNVEFRTSRGRATREFVEARLAESQRTLASAEQMLAAFRQNNVRIGGSAQLQLEQARLEREVETRSELYRMLAREYESARIEEKRDTPTFTVVDPARPPVRKYRPRTSLNVLIAFAAALGIRVLLRRLSVLRRPAGAHARGVPVGFADRDIPARA